MKWTLILVATILAIGGQARAADLPAPTLPPPVPAIYNWNGIYVGVNGGWGDGNSNWTSGSFGETGRFQISGYVVGGTIGANYQVGAYVFGIEGDFDWNNVHGNSGPTCGAIADAVSPPTGCQTQSEWLGTVRGRVGYAVNSVLIYGTGGAAFGNVQTGLIPPSTFDGSTEAGWTIGAGIEVGFAPNWTAKAEYLFVDLPDATCTTVANCGGAVGSSVSFNENIVRAGVNFKFGAW
ncbi:MAG: outer membrane protein [Xanthobacteraceae bacterium]